MARPVIIDCDPGQDDALALLLALAAPDALRVLGITTVVGNAPVARCARNAQAVCELAGRTDLRVFAGCEHPLVRDAITGEHTHGPGGLGGVELPEPKMPLAPSHAVDFLVGTLRHATEPVTLVVTGPQTNVATALRRVPQIASKIERIVAMGGAIRGGNVTPFAEFNIHVDPQAAEIVLSLGVPVTFFGLDVTHQVIATDERIASIRALDNPVARAVADMLEFYGRQKKAAGFPGAPLHDPCTIAWLLEPALFEGSPMRVRIETREGPRTGQTSCASVPAEAANALVMHWADVEGFFRLLTERLGFYSNARG